MSLTLSPLSSLLQSSFNAQLLASTNAASGTSDDNSIGAITTAALGGPNSATSGLATDFASLFKDLASNDVSAAQTDLTQLEKDLGTSSSATSSPLQKLFSSLSTSLSSDDATGALQTLTSFFVQNGTSTGNVVNTTA